MEQININVFGSLGVNIYWDGVNKSPVGGVKLFWLLLWLFVWR